MKVKKKFKVMAVMETHCYLDVEAINKEEAYEIASDTDGGEFIADNSWGSGDWRISMDNVWEYGVDIEEVNDGQYES